MIDMCQYCQLDTTGNHEYNCLLRIKEYNKNINEMTYDDMMDLFGNIIIEILK